MRFQQFTDAAIATDGGTFTCRAILDDGSILECGLDARLPKTKAQSLVFIGADYPNLPGAQIFARDSPEEQEFVSALREYVSRVPSDKIAAEFLSDILDATDTAGGI